MTATGLSEALFDLLSTDLPITGGWFPLRLPDGVALPAGTYQRISSVGAQTHSGANSLRTRRYQLTVFSVRYVDGLSEARNIVAALNGTRSAWGGWDVTAMVADDAEDMDPEPRGLFRQRIDVMLSSEAP